MINKITKFKDLEIWQEAHSLALEIYRVTRNFPREEIYGLISQIRRSAVSVAACIVEGQSRNTTKDFIRFLFEARSSCAETKYHLLLAKDLGYISGRKFEELNNRYEILGKRINSLISSLEKNSKC